MIAVAEPQKYAELLTSWDVKREQETAEFLDWLYEFYECTDGFYTGLYQRFLAELSEGVITDLEKNHPEEAEIVRRRLEWVDKG